MPGFKEQNVQIKLTVDSKQVLEENKRLGKSILEIQEGFKNIQPNTKAFEQQLKKLTAESEKFAKTLSLKELRREYNRLKRAIADVKPNTPEFRKLEAQLKGVGREFNKVRAAQRGLNDGFKKSPGLIGKVGTALKSLGPFLAAAFAIEKIVSFTKELFTTGNALDAMQGKFQTVFGESTQIVEDFADGIGTEIGLSSNKIKELATNTGDLLKPMGFLEDEAANISTGVLALSGALSEWSGGTKDTAEVQEILTKALLGEREQLKTLGIAINEADVQQQLLANGAKGLTGELGQQAKAVATLELIMAKSTDAQTAFAEGNDTMGRNMARANASFQEAKERLSAALIPVFERFAAALAPAATFLADLIGYFTDGSKRADEFSGSVQVLGKVFEIVGKAVNFVTIPFQYLWRLAGQLLDTLGGFEVVSARVVNGIANIVNAITQSGISQSIQNALGFEVKAIELIDIEALENQADKAVGVTEDYSEKTNSLLSDLTKKIKDNSDKQVANQEENQRKAQAAAEKHRKELEKTQIKAAEDRLKADRENQKLRIEAMEDGFEKEKALLELQAQERISALVGDPSQIAANTQLIKDILAEQLNELSSESFDAELTTLANSAMKRIEALTGTPEQVRTQTAAIQAELQAAIQQLLAQYGIATGEASEKVQAFFKALGGQGQEVVFEAIDIQFDVQTLDLKQQLKEGLISVAQFEAATVKLREDAINQKLALLDANGEQETEQYRQLTDQLLDLQLERADAEAEQQEEIDKKKEEKQKAYEELAYETAEQVAATIFNIQRTNVDKELKTKLSALDKQKAAELKAAGDNEKKKAEIEAKFEKQKLAAEKEAAQKKKAIAIKEAIINAAIAVTKTIAQLGFASPLIGPALAALAVTTGIQLATIESQEFEKGAGLKLENGRFVVLSKKTRAKNRKAVDRLVKRSGGTVLQGPSHQDGGVPLTNNGQIVGIAEGGEPLIPFDNLDAVDQAMANSLLYASLFNNGRFFQNGGVLALPSTATSGQSGANSGGVTTILVQQNEDLKAELVGLRQDVQTMKTSLRAYITIEDLEDGIEEIDGFNERAVV